MNGGARMRACVLRALERIERLGNRLPDPITLFAVMIGLVMVASWICTALAVRVTHPGTGEEIAASNLFASENLRRILAEMPQTFAAFPPLGLVLVVMLGIGVAERSGLVAAALKAFVRSVPPRLITVSVIFAGILSSLAADAGYVVLIPLGAVVFHGAGRHPIAGLAAAFAGVSGGFTANLSLTMLDPLLAGFSTPAARLLNAEYTVLPTANWWLMIALTPILSLAGAWVTERVLEPRLGAYAGPAPEGEALVPPAAAERRGLRAAAIVALGCLLVIVLLAAPENGVLRDPDGELFAERMAPLLGSMVGLMFFCFLLPGLAYGIVTGSIRNDRDLAGMAAGAMSSMGAYIVLAFAAAHLVALFSWSNLGTIMAIGGAGLLERIGLTGLPLVVSFILLTALLNLFIGSASAKWAIMAPVFVPMFMLLGYSPELTQAAYRIGDSFTNILTPLLPYFPLIIIFARKYEPGIGIGSIAAAMLPYSIVFALAGIGTLVCWLVFQIPLGPGAPMHYQP